MAYHRLLVSYYLVPNERSTRGSRLLLPVHRIATAVETGDDGQRFVGFDDKHQRVGKVAQQSTANAFVDDRKLPGIGAHALDYGIDRRAEISAQARRSFSYQSCASINSARAIRRGRPG